MEKVTSLSKENTYTHINMHRGYLAWKQWPAASLHIAPSSLSAWDLWRRGPPHTRPPPTGRSVWQRWHPSPTHMGSSQSTWLVPPESKEQQPQSHILPTLQFPFSWLFFVKWNHPCICSLCSNASLTLRLHSLTLALGRWREQKILAKAGFHVDWALIFSWAGQQVDTEKGDHISHRHSKGITNIACTSRFIVWAKSVTLL